MFCRFSRIFLANFREGAKNMLESRENQGDLGINETVRNEPHKVLNTGDSERNLGLESLTLRQEPTVWSGSLQKWGCMD